MVNKVKYLQDIVLKDGTKKWAFNPPTYLKERLECEFEQYDNRTDAVQRCLEMDELHQRWRNDTLKQVRVNSATVLGMIGFYKTTDAWSARSDNTKRTYNQLFRGLQKVRLGKSSGNFVDMLASNVREEHVQKVYAYLRDEISLHRARHTVKLLKRVWNVCERHKKLQGNPWKTIELDTDNICDVTWTERQIDRFIAAADEMGFWSLGTLTMLCFDLCQRPGDMRQLTWNNFDGEFFTFTQEKTGTKIEIKSSNRLIERITPRHNQYSGTDCIVLYEKTGRPYDNRKYNEIAQQVRKACMLPDQLKMKFLRHTGATELAENGATEDMIAAVTGHKSRQMLNIYVKKTKKLAATAQDMRGR